MRRRCWETGNWEMQHGPFLAGQRFGMWIVAGETVYHGWAVFEPVIEKFGLGFRSCHTNEQSRIGERVTPIAFVQRWRSGRIDHNILERVTPSHNRQRNERTGRFFEFVAASRPGWFVGFVGTAPGV